MEPEDKVQWPEIPEPIRELFGELWNDVSVLHAKWNVCHELFGSRENIELLNRTNPILFGLLQESLWHDIAMSIGRLVDRAQDGRQRENISLPRLVEGLVHCQDWQRRNIDKMLNEVQDHCQDLAKIRNKRVAHCDLSTRLHPDIHALPELSTDYIPRALALIGHLMASIQVCYMEETTDFDSDEPRNSAAELIELLKRSSDPSSRQAASPS
jgi:AbiU2